MSIVIIGGGQAGVQTAASLREGGYEDPITIVADEGCLPYQRPPLSKDHLKDDSGAPLPLRGADFFAQQDISLLQGKRAVSVNRDKRIVHLRGGGELRYSHLVFATGARNRTLPCNGAALAGVYGLRTINDAEALKQALPTARNVVVIGAGFIGLEFAAVALSRGCRVTVLEYAPRPMGRALSPYLGEWFAHAHRKSGINLRLSEGISSLESDGSGRVTHVISTTGERYPADLVVTGVGVEPNDDIATQAGLATNNGIVVDDTLRTADPAVFAVGDCANFPAAYAPGPCRLESVQNATDQARHVAQVILGAVEPYDQVPWFWSIQGKFRLQMAGLTLPGDDTVVLGDPETGKFSVLCFRHEVLVAVESVNKPGDHLAARKILAARLQITRQDTQTEGFSLNAASKNQIPVHA